MLTTLLNVFSAAVLAVFGWAFTVPKQPVAVSASEHSEFYSLKQTPEAAAACIAHHAEFQRFGLHTDVRPLFGTEKVAVTVREGHVGQMLALIQLDGGESGSDATVTFTQGDADSRFIAALMNGC